MTAAKIIVTLNPHHDPAFAAQFKEYVHNICGQYKIDFLIEYLDIEAAKQQSVNVVPNIQLLSGDTEIDYAEGRFGLYEKLTEFVERCRQKTKLPTAQAPAMPQPLFRSAAICHDNALYITGGFNESAQNEVYRYDLKNGSGSNCHKLLTARYGHSLSADEAAMLVMGGSGDSGYLQSIEQFKWHDNSWQPIAQLGAARAQHAVIKLLDGDQLILGGYRLPAQSGPEYFAERFYAKNTICQPAAGMMENPVGNSVTSIDDRSVIAAGGFPMHASNPVDRHALRNVWRWSVNTECWEQIGELIYPRAFHSAVIDRSGRYLAVAGGYDKHQTVTSVEIFCLDTGRTISQFPLLFPRSNHISLCTQHNEVLVAGGINGHQGVSALERFKFSSRKTEIAGFLNRSRHGFSCANYNDEQLILAGGIHEGKISSDFEIIDLNTYQ